MSYLSRVHIIVHNKRLLLNTFKGETIGLLNVKEEGHHKLKLGHQIQTIS